MPAAVGVTVEVASFSDLLSDRLLKLALDDYQRPYVWGTEKIDQLVRDLKEFSGQANGGLDYYMGAVLIHEHSSKGRRFIIDGQQRLTSLCVLHHRLSGRLPEGQELDFRSPESARRIRRARARLDSLDLHPVDVELLERIRFTVITVQNEDLAFTFFDTQNNRGVPLGATDLLKAYHLRAITGPHSESLRSMSAERWERLQRLEPSTLGGAAADFAPKLFNQYLWRARRWTGQKEQLVRETRDQVLDEFQARSLKPVSPESVRLYPSRLNCIGEVLVWTQDNRPEVASTAPSATLRGPSALPFAVRQPLTAGLGFFLYADKYAHIVKELLSGDPVNRELVAFHDFYERVVADVSPYLRELYLLAIVMYIDRLGYTQLLRFALWLDHVVGAIRLGKHYIKKEAPIMFLRDSRLNILDMIASAFRPEDVIDYLKADSGPNRVYDSEDNVTGKGVRGQYKQRVFDYYGRSGSLHGKAGWITEAFIRERLQ